MQRLVFKTRFRSIKKKASVEYMYDKITSFYNIFNSVGLGGDAPMYICVLAQRCEYDIKCVFESILQISFRFG